MNTVDLLSVGPTCEDTANRASKISRKKYGAGESPRCTYVRTGEQVPKTHGKRKVAVVICNLTAPADKPEWRQESCLKLSGQLAWLKQQGPIRHHKLESKDWPRDWLLTSTLVS